MKVKEKELARKLRSEGKSVRDICRVVGVSKASVSVWVRDIELSEDQKIALLESSYNNPGVFLGAAANREKFLKIRRSYQEEGKTTALKKEWLFVAGCMLYWGEGFKRKNTAGIGNSDPYLLLLFIKFLQKYFNIRKEEIELKIQCYVDRVESIVDIEKYWTDMLGLTKDNIKKAQIDQRPRSSIHKGKGRFLNYGVCRISVHRTDVVQKIYGAIQEIGNFSKPEWLF